ncbi:TetR/AcrR family transcriptional regulator [Cognatiyoonia sp. IB215446]|uniref:TetR/AcrR family transcriptional regulator n=1 Tax=Cognatiyoonia sp. IB215446 TaxID=3097355 RepID=UPI002A0E0196|nr:TetR/AcrR family transcriptional regulator [Cognatiyoonia sp. IB215446]MDX8346693.1 TetR/AcrR family transcriptional regulator [Cognatiyoonia sp. IB215446]
MPDGTIEPKKGRKFDQVLDGARTVFLSDGFEGASVDDIARAAGVSKATLYSYFPDKRFLFMQVAKTECQRQADLAIETIDMDAPIRQVLHDIATEMVDFMTSQFGKQIFRICVGESDRFPELGREFYESGPVMIRAKLIDFFEKGVARGDLKIDDFELAAEQFHELSKADLFPKLVFNIAEDFTHEEKERVVNGAVDMFMARYGT